MKRYRRRGAFLPQLLLMMPLWVAIATLALLLCARIVRYEGRVTRQAAEETRWIDLAHRVERDARNATTATLQTREGVSELVLGSVTYQLEGRRIRRSENRADQAPFAWSQKFESADVQLTLESVQGRPAVVWVTLTLPSLTESGPPIPRTCSKAARIGAGGAS